MAVFHLRVAIAVCAVVGLYDVIFAIGSQLDDRTLAHATRPLIGLPLNFPDFLTAYGAVQAYLAGKLAVVYGFQAFPAFLLELFGTSFAPLPLLYPPVWIVAFLPFGLLPIHVAIPVFLVFTIALFAIVNWRDPWMIVIVVTSPAALWAVLAGQNTFLYVALFYGGMRLAERSPAVGGVLLGLLVYKPHVCLLVPIALLASRQWKALIWMIGAGTAAVVASAIVLGPQAWFDYVIMAGQMSRPENVLLLVESLGRHLLSPLTAMLILHVPVGAANAVQFATMIVAAGVVWFAFRRYPASDERMAVLVAGTLLAAPYGLFYDLLLLVPAIVALYRRGIDDGFYPAEIPVCFLLFLQPMTMWWINTRAPITPLLIVLFGLFAVLRLQRTTSRPPVHALQRG